MAKPFLGVNVDHVATLRQARYRGAGGGMTPEPSVLQAALAAERAGANGITVHLREDRRHIQDADVALLREHITTRLNLEMAVTGEMIEHALGVRPDEACLVPENRREVTTEGGLDVRAKAKACARACARLGEAGIVVSAFIDPEPDQVAASADAGAAFIELHTGAFANATTKRERRRELARHARALEQARGLGLKVNAGHGLHYDNLAEFLAAVRGLHTLNIGHAIVSRAVFGGLGAAVRDMRRIIRQAP